MTRFHTITSPNPNYNPRGVKNPDADDSGQPKFLVEPDLRKLITEDIPFMPDEEAQRDAEEAKRLTNTLMRQWQREMAEASWTMPDGLEVLWDAVGLTAASQETKDAHAAKKAVRVRKPG